MNTFLKGKPVSHGIAVGEVLVYRHCSTTVAESYFEEGLEAHKKETFQLAVGKAEDELNAIIESLSQSSEAKIFMAHKEILFDEDMLETVEDEIGNNRKEPDFAVMGVFEEFIELMGLASDPMIAARVTDLRDVRDRLLRILQGKEEKNLSKLANPVIVVTDDLLPGDTATLDRENVLGIITEVGGETSHTAIIANSYRIPAVLGVKNCTEALRDGMTVALDALDGTIYCCPDEKILEDVNTKRLEYAKKLETESQFLEAELITADGVKIEIGVNIGSDKALGNSGSYDFVGLFRTEFLYMEQDRMPSEQEQFEAYKKVMEAASGKPVTLRTLDIGGDKSLSYMKLPQEANPFLGKRALRLCFDMEDIFRTQLRAALRASAYGEMWIMLPMVGSIDDIRKARAIFDEVKQELSSENIPIGGNVKLGIMVEIPAIAAVADLAADEVDFASIGTNDLCQYLCAVDRMNAELTGYYQSLSPAMLRTIGFISEQFDLKSKPLSVCGEMAGNPLAAKLLVGLGIRKLSMSESSIARVKAELSKISAADAAAVAAILKSLRTEGDVIEYVSRVPVLNL